MLKQIKQKTITFGELKKIKIEISNKWLQDLWRRFSDKEKVQIDLKDLVNKILKQYERTKICKRK